jgi:hypothetical protein
MTYDMAKNEPACRVESDGEIAWQIGRISGIL